MRDTSGDEKSDILEYSSDEQPQLPRKQPWPNAQFAGQGEAQHHCPPVRHEKFVERQGVETQALDDTSGQRRGDSTAHHMPGATVDGWAGTSRRRASITQAIARDGSSASKVLDRSCASSSTGSTAVNKSRAERRGGP